MTDFATALAYLRANYSDDYSDRNKLAGDMGRFARKTETAIPYSPAFGGEGVLQPILRYQTIPAADVEAQIRRKVGDDDAETIMAMCIAFADARGAEQ